MVETIAIVKNDRGIHCRPSTQIVTEFKDYDGDILIHTENGQADLTSVLGLVALGLEANAKVLIRVTGADEESVAEKVRELFEYPFDFPISN
ncbi:MAG: HPr family phosphocarrier protein [Lentisphaeria bacterium]|nr:HPr family phosphocarrier protein [Lentisphaeria bacterium]